MQTDETPDPEKQKLEQQRVTLLDVEDVCEELLNEFNRKTFQPRSIVFALRARLAARAVQS
jgi:hypothetical protein